MKNLHLVVDFSRFHAIINSAIVDLSDFKQELQEIDDVNKLKDRKQRIVSDILESLGNSFNEQENYFKNKFRMADVQRFRIPGHTPNIIHIKDRISKEFSKKIDQLNKTLKTVENCKRIQDDKNYKQENLTIRQKQNFLLKTLHRLYDDRLYDIEVLFIGNGIFEGRNDEFNEIGSELDDEGLINSSFTSDGFFAGLTLKGMKYVEEIVNKEIELSTQRSKAKKEFSTKNNNDLKKYIRKGIIYTLERLDHIIISDKGIDDLTKIWGRYYRLQAKINNGIITNEEVTLEENRISNALFDLIDNLSQKDLLI